MAVLSRIATAAAVTSIVLAVTATPALAATETTGVVCSYQLMQWPGGFTAEISIANSGPAINGWAVHWTFDTPTTIGAVWSARLVQDPSGVSATNMAYNPLIGTGRSASFGWNGAAASTTVPTDLTVNGRPCLSP
jgi:Cellulose binding domain